MRSLLIDAGRWEERRSVAAGELAPLADSLAAELEPLLATDLYIPEEKAVLSREGGRCAADGTLLEFHPFERSRHRCTACGCTYAGELHDRFWIYWYQLWLAERAVHSALLYRLRGDERHAALARAILDGYATRYLLYPNRDNVLGPSRVFFSTYIESIWLLQLCIALDLLEPEENATAFADRVRERVIEPSAAIIAIYDEGLSNRQTWNNAALLAAHCALGRASETEPIVQGRGGLLAHLERGLLADGTWYEGENYHLFAHRGLWYGVTIAERLGVAIPPTLASRFQEGFATPFLTALPDQTLVSRRDSQYAISIRQVRFAEACELGLARANDGRLAATLATLYDGSLPKGDTGRWRSTADVERNLPPSALTRADLGWRSLVHALPTLPRSSSGLAQSVLLEAQGIAVMRRERGRVYVGLDFGHSGGGHGHPDRLNLLLADGTTRWLDDMGTGSYVDRSLFWYRSTLAHNAPLIDGCSQTRAHGRLVAFDERGGVGWIDAAADGLASGVRLRRAVVVTPDYLIDEVSWTADRSVTIDLPFHVDGDLDGVSPWERQHVRGGVAPDDGFEFVRDTEVARPVGGVPVRLRAASGERALRAWIATSPADEWWRGTAPGAPGSADRRFLVVRLRAGAGTIRSVWSWHSAVTSVTFAANGVEIATTDGACHRHGRVADGWRIELLAGNARSSIDLRGARATSPAIVTDDVVGVYGDATLRQRSPAADMPSLRRGERLRFALGQPHYRRTELAWHDAGSPTASVAVEWSGAQVLVAVEVVKAGQLTFASEDAVNRYDNEAADINGDGLQVYVQHANTRGAWVIVPALHDPSVRVRSIPGWLGLASPSGAWRRTDNGYAVDVAIPLEVAPDDRVVLLDIIVNEMSPERERRRGQLVLSGAAGEFAYLTGDRHDPERLLPFVITR